jgi:hypothetical protein
VSERLATHSFGEMMYRIYNDDLPVFVSADAILQAWHRAYSSMLQELEETYFYNEWIAVLGRMAEQLPELWQQHGNGALREPLLDADYFLAVALSLGTGTNTPSRLNQDGRVAETLGAVQGEQIQLFNLFGSCRRVDFSQFRPRGHYNDSPPLTRYFKMVMWLGRTEFRITPAKADPECNGNDPARELASSALLYYLLQAGGGFEAWSQINAVINVFVGEPDSMNFGQLGALLKAANINGPADLEVAQNFARLHEMLLSGNFGVQEIMSDTYISPAGKLPRTFTVFGQRFVADSWLLGKVVFDNIRWQGDAVKRRLPFSLDVAFGALRNNATVSDIVAQIEKSGYPYQHNLAAARNVIDAQPAPFWEKNIYNYWLGALRALSEPTTGANFPQAMRTHAWSLKNLNTQLASWTHLRHNTVLYAKQSYSGGIICSYPKAYVEPVPKFWNAMKKMAGTAADLIGALELAPRQITYMRDQYWQVQYDSKRVQSNQVTFLRAFSERMAMMEDIAVRELAHQPLTAEQIEALRNVVEIQQTYDGRRYTGWYPNLFYKSCFFDSFFQGMKFHHSQGCDRADYIITDVHTAPSPPSPAYVLHQAVGKVNFLLIAVDCGEEHPVIYGGPVLSHYELPTEGTTRYTDTEWADDIMKRPTTVPPTWTQEYLVRP